MLKPFLSSFLFLSAGCAAFAQSSVPTCILNSVPTLVRSEGLAERVGDVVLNCSGGRPGMVITGNLSVFLNANITNRTTNGIATDVVFTLDNGAGPQGITVPGMLVSNGQIVYNGVNFTLSSTGGAVLRIANLRANASQLTQPPYSNITAFLAFNGENPVFPNGQVVVANALRGLFTGFSTKIICSQNGSPLPSNTGSLAAFVGAGSVFGSTRITEGFADALGPKSAPANFNADTGERVIIRYGGFPAGARLFVPDVVAGSDALQPTAGGDFGLPASGGRYIPSVGGSLLLARVQGADANGAGGIPVFVPGAVGSAAVAFDSVSEVGLASDGSANAVYEVVDANNAVIESAQFPTFLGLSPSGLGNAVQTTESVNLAPVSTVTTAVQGAPIPRFIQITPQADCTLIGDCGANYFPLLFLPDPTPIQFNLVSGGNTQVHYVPIRNGNSGVLQYNVSIVYQGTAKGYLTVTPNGGVNNSTVRVDANASSLTPGTYLASLLIDAGPLAGTKTIPITVTVSGAAIIVPRVTGVVNAASYANGPVVPGSLSTIMGQRFGGKSVSVLFNNQPARILFSNDGQINVEVPQQLATQGTAQVTVSVDGATSDEQTVNLAPTAPAIFQGAVLNQDYSVNTTSVPARVGSVLQIYATGLSGTGRITARIHDRTIDLPYYAGPAPGFIGVQQVDLVIPADLPAMTTNVYVCGTATDGSTVCSAPAAVTLAQ